MVEELGVSGGLVGLWDGILQAIAFICRIFSGMLSDYLRRRRFLLIVGYSFAALSRPILAFAPFLSIFMVGHLFDRLGNGIQAAPRDALIGDIAPENLKGECYGLRQSLAILGSILGPLLLIPLLVVTTNNYRLIFALSLIPALLGIVALVFMVKEPSHKDLPKKRPTQFFKLSELRSFPKSFWLVIGVSSLFTMARFGESFLILRGKNLGLSSEYIPLVMLVMNIFNALSAYPFGLLSDMFDRRLLLVVSFLFLVAADVMLGFTDTLPMAFLGIALWGVQLGSTTSLISTMISDTAPPALRATGFGIFYVISGLLHILAGWFAGHLWDTISPSTPFIYGAVVSVIACLSIVVLPSFRNPKTLIA